MLIRPATLDDVPGIARVNVDTWRAAYRDLIPADVLDGLSYAQSEARWRSNITGHHARNCLHVALAGGAIIGYAGGGPERNGIDGYDGEIYALYVAADQQRQGIGQQLVRSVTQEMASLGLTSVLIWVLRDNQPGRRLYEKLGGVYVTEQPFNIGGHELIEVAYGWPDINALIREKG